MPFPLWHLFQACERTCILWYRSNFVLPEFIVWLRCKVFSTLGEDSFVHTQLVLVPSSSVFIANTQSLRKFHIVWHKTYTRLHAFPHLSHPLPAHLVVDGKVWSCAGKVVLLQSRTTYAKKSLSDFFKKKSWAAKNLFQHPQAVRMQSPTKIVGQLSLCRTFQTATPQLQCWLTWAAKPLWHSTVLVGW